jgi:hypothetical protein
MEDVVGKGAGGWIWCKQCIHVYVNAKMIPVETAPGTRGRGMKESSGWGEFKCDISDILQEHLKCYNVPPSSTTIKKEKANREFSL